MSDGTMENQGGAENKGKGFPFVKVIVIIIIMAVLVAAGYYVMKQSGTDAGVAIVNGRTIARSLYDERFAQLSAAIVSQGQTATSTDMQAAIKTQTLDNLVTEAMLLQAAENEGLKVKDEEVDAALAQNKTQFADEAAFQTALQAQGYTESSFRDVLVRDNIIAQYLRAHIDLTSVVATEEEVKTLYDQAKASDATIPPLEEVRAQVENQIVQQKQQVIITSFIQTLRASSTIEILI